MGKKERVAKKCEEERENGLFKGLGICMGVPLTTWTITLCVGLPLTKKNHMCLIWRLFYHSYIDFWPNGHSYVSLTRHNLHFICHTPMHLSAQIKKLSLDKVRGDPSKCPFQNLKFWICFLSSSVARGHPSYTCF